MYTGKAHPHPWTYADTLALHTLCQDNYYLLWALANIQICVLDYREGILPSGWRCLLPRSLVVDKEYSFPRHLRFVLGQTLETFENIWKIPRGCTEIL